jgi:hypothetical protein
MKHEAAKLYGLMGKRKWMILAALLLAALGMQAQRVDSNTLSLTNCYYTDSSIIGNTRSIPPALTTASLNSSMS